MNLAIVTATANPTESQECRASWATERPHQTYVVVNGITNQVSDVPPVWDELPFGLHTYHSPQFLGVVPAFAIGVQKALDDGAEIIACFHDDLEIQDPTWDEQVSRIFKTCPKAGLVGFGGALGLGDPRIYQIPYDPMQLARRGFLSNMQDAEAHGSRTTSPQPIAVLDGFSQIGHRQYWLGQPRDPSGWDVHGTDGTSATNLFAMLRTAGLVHHAYDAALGIFAKQLGYQVWLAPVAVRHFGGRTAVGNRDYQAWAQTQVANGDQGFWLESHRLVFDMGRGILPI